MQVWSDVTLILNSVSYFYVFKFCASFLFDIWYKMSIVCIQWWNMRVQIWRMSDCKSNCTSITDILNLSFFKSIQRIQNFLQLIKVITSNRTQSRQHKSKHIHFLLEKPSIPYWKTVVRLFIEYVRWQMSRNKWKHSSPSPPLNVIRILTLITQQRNVMRQVTVII